MTCFVYFEPAPVDPRGRILELIVHVLCRLARVRATRITWSQRESIPSHSSYHSRSNACIVLKISNHKSFNRHQNMVDTSLDSGGKVGDVCSGSSQEDAAIQKNYDGDRDKQLTKDMLDSIFAQDNPHKQFE